MSNSGIYELDGNPLVITMCSRLGNEVSGEIKYQGKYHTIPKFECHYSNVRTDEALIDRFKVLLDEAELEKQIESQENQEAK